MASALSEGVVFLAMGPRLPIPKTLADELVNLTPVERVELAYDIWDSLQVDSDSEAAAVYAQQRLADYRCEPAAMVGWESFLVRLRSSPE